MDWDVDSGGVGDCILLLIAYGNFLRIRLLSLHSVKYKKVLLILTIALQIYSLTMYRYGLGIWCSRVQYKIVLGKMVSEEEEEEETRPKFDDMPKEKLEEWTKLMTNFIQLTYLLKKSCVSEF